MKTIKESIRWILFVIYMTILFALTVAPIIQVENDVDKNQLLIQELQVRKEYHIQVSEENNQLLREILRELREDK